MACQIEPAELNFQRPFTVEVSRTLTIKNPNAAPIAFKVKTTAPKQYCVRPNSGRIEPGHDVEVTVLLQAMKAEPPPDTKCRDKFLVQSALITSDKEFASIQNVLETTDKSMLQEKKIRVSWLAADEGVGFAGPAATPIRQPHLNGEAEAEVTPDISRAYGSPGDDSGPGAATPHTSDDNKSASHDAPEEDTTKSTIRQAKENVVQTAQLSYDEIKAELDKAKAEIVVLKQQAQLRLRKAAGNTDRPTTEQMATAMKQTVDGVPVRVVATLCFITFLFAYLFF